MRYCFLLILALNSFALNSFYDLVTVRTLKSPTRAELDLAAWVDNSLFVEPGGKLDPTTPVVSYQGKSLASIAKVATALPKQVTAKPLSFMAVKRALSLEKQWDLLASVYTDLSKVEGMRPQRLYVSFGDKAQMWVEVKSPRHTEYVQVQPSLWVASQDQFKAWLDSAYVSPVLNSAQILDWAIQTASYWYPSLNTDLVWDLPDSNWPGESVEAPVRAFMGKQRIAHPTIVIRGNPLGTPHYTVLSIAGLAPLAQRNDMKQDSQSAVVGEKLADRQLPVNYVRNMERFQTEIQNHGGSYAAWDSSLAGLRTKWQRILDSLPQGQMGFEGQQKWLFFRRSLQALIHGGEGEDPLPQLIDFKGRLEAAEVNMLFVPVPTKVELYADLLPGGKAGQSTQILNIWLRKFMMAAQDEGLEIVDLLPPFIDARTKDASSKETLYQKDDTHWTRRGMLIAAQILADRVKQYSWYSSLNPNVSRFRVRDTLYARLGDIVERLPAERQANYSPASLQGSRVYVNDTVPYQGPKGAPIILIGDSFTGVMESVDCRNGGIGAHLARLTGLDVEVITSWGGGPNVRAKFLKARKAQLAQARLVIYMMTARDLVQYPGGWEPLDAP